MKTRRVATRTSSTAGDVLGSVSHVGAGELVLEVLPGGEGLASTLDDPQLAAVPAPKWLRAVSGL